MNEILSSYLIENGIQPWRNTHVAQESSFQTLLIVTFNEEELVRVLDSLFTRLAKAYRRIVRWHTIGHSFSGNKLQFKKLKTELGQDLPGTKSTYYGEFGSSGVWCNTSEITLPFNQEHLMYLFGGRYTILAMTAEENCDSKSMWKTLSSHCHGYDRESLKQVLDEHHEFVLVQFDSDTELCFAVQLFASDQQIAAIAEILDHIGVNAVTTRNDVVSLINSS